MSTRSWSFIAAGFLILLAVAGFAIGYFINRSRSNQNPDSEQD